MRSKVINIVEKFYICVLMSVKFWWVLIKNFVVYGLAAATTSIVTYYITPEEDRDLHQKVNTDTKLNLKFSGIISIVATFLISCWIASLVMIAKTHSDNLFLIIFFWISAAWSIVILTYLIDLGLAKSTEEYNNDKFYYIKAAMYFLRTPQITLTVAVLWIVMSIFIVKNAVIAVFVMPGFIAGVTGKLYRLLNEKREVESK